MKTYTLQRLRQSNLGTFGELRNEQGQLLCVTCEDPWNDNQRGESCIPAGLYTCLPHSGVKYKDVWEVVNVPNRSAILIHNGNTIRDTQGCILVGSAFGEVEHLPAVVNSKATLNRLRKELPSCFTLVVKDVA